MKGKIYMKMLKMIILLGAMIICFTGCQKDTKTFAANVKSNNNNNTVSPTITETAKITVAPETTVAAEITVAPEVSIIPVKSGTDESSDIVAIKSRNCAYVYHLLSVAKCGYNNVYSKKYTSFHAAKDLKILNKNKKYLTVAGGEDSSQLYWLLVAYPASMEDSIDVGEYYASISDLFKTGDVTKNYKKHQKFYHSLLVNAENVSNMYKSFKEYAETCSLVAKVFAKNYSIYIDQVWEEASEEIDSSVDGLNNIFNKKDYKKEWKEVLGCEYPDVSFQAVICNSMKGGAEAINISDTKDVFSTSDTVEAKANFISHEYGIFILMKLLADTTAFTDMDNYQLTESLAEYFNMQITGTKEEFCDQKWIDFYDKLRSDNPAITPKEMYQKAVEATTKDTKR